MKVYLTVEEGGLISGTSTTPEEGTIEIEVDEEHPVLLEFGKYRYIDGGLVRMSEEEVRFIYSVIDPPTEKERLETLEIAMLELMMESRLRG